MLVVEDFFNHVKSANKKYKHYHGIWEEDYKDYLKSFDNAMLFEVDSKLIFDSLSNIIDELNHLPSKDRLSAMMHYIDSFPIEQLALPAPTTYITMKNLGYSAIYGADNAFTSFLITKDLIAVYVYNSELLGQKHDIIFYQYGIWYTNDVLTTHKLVSNIILLLELQYEVDKLHCAVPCFIFNRLQVHSDFNIGEDPDTNAAYLNYQDKIIIYKDTMLFPSCLIETIKCWSLKHLIVFKEVRGTEKDIEDILKIKTWMQLNSIMQVSDGSPKPSIISIQL